MKNFPFRIYISIILYILLISACNNKKQSHDYDENDQIENILSEVEELQEKAAQDSGFINSKEYASRMVQANIEMAKKTNNMPVNEKLLFEYEVTIKNLKLNTDKIKQNPDLLKDVAFEKETQIKAGKVREYYQRLQKANLNQQEKEKFDKLNHQ